MTGSVSGNVIRPEQFEVIEEPKKKQVVVPAGEFTTVDDIKPLNKSSVEAPNETIDASLFREVDVPGQQKLLREVANEKPNRKDLPAFRAIKGFKGSAPQLNFTDRQGNFNINIDQKQMLEIANEGLPAKLFNLAIKGREQVEKERVAEINDFFNRQINPILEELEELEFRDDAETNPEVKARIKELDEQYQNLSVAQKRELAGEIDPELEQEFTSETLGNIWEAVKDDPGGVGGEFINAFIADPQYFLVPLGWKSGAASFAARLPNAGKKVKAIAKATGGTAGAASTGAVVEAGTEAGKQFAETGNVDVDRVMKAAKTGGAVSGILAPVGALGINAARATKAQLQKIGKSKVDERINNIDPKDKTVTDITDEVIDTKNGKLRSKERLESGDFGNVSTVGASQAKTSRLGRLLGGAVEKLADKTRKFGRLADEFAGPISSRIQKISPRIANRFSKMHQDVSLRINENRAKIQPFGEAYSNLNKATRSEIDLHLKNNRLEAAKNVMREVGGENFVKSFEQVQAVVAKLRQDLIDAGQEVEFLENFFPRTVKDFSGLLDSLGEIPASRFRRLVNKRQEKLGRELTDEEQSELLTRSITDKTNPLSIPSSAKTRTIEQVTPESNVFYEDSLVSLLRYIDEFSDSIETRRFFNDLGAGESSASKSINKLMNELNDISGTNAIDLENILKARFVDAKKTQSGFIRGLRGTVTLGTLGNLSNAITQIGDVFLSAYRNGYFRTAQAALQRKNITPEDIGVFRIEQEFAEQGLLTRTIDRVFKTTGFRNIDRFGKTTLINGAFNKAAARVKKPKSEAKFREEHIDTYGDEIDDLVDALKRGDTNNENVKLYLWNELSKNQPISLAEMPEVYLRNPNGRIFYALKTFTIKLLDIQRREIFGEIAQGNVRSGIQNGVRLGTAMWLGGMTADTIKDFILGRDTEFEDQAIDNLWGIIGLNSFVLNQDLDEGLKNQLLGSAFASIGVGGDIAKDLKKLMTDEDFSVWEANSFRRIPLIGNVFEGVQRRIEREED